MQARSPSPIAEAAMQIIRTADPAAAFQKEGSRLDTGSLSIRYAQVLPPFGSGPLRFYQPNGSDSQLRKAPL